MSDLFTITEIENTISEESAEVGDYASTEVSEAAPADFRAALRALLNGCWDTIDLDARGQIIAYPADYPQDMRTGEWSGTTVVVTPKHEHHGARLMDAYEAKRSEVR